MTTEATTETTEQIPSDWGVGTMYDAPPMAPGGGFGFNPKDADLQRDDTITAPVPDWLVPPAVKPAAYKWSVLDKKLDEAETELYAARSALASAPGQDRQARKSALAAGKRFSGQPATAKATERMGEAIQNMRLLNELNREAALNLIRALRANRADVVALTSNRLTPAIAGAREAAAEAEAMVRKAAAEVAEARAGVELLKGLDSNESDWIGAFTPEVPTPDFAPHHHHLNNLESEAGKVEDPLSPERITVRLENGLTMTVKPEVARMLIDQGAEEVPVYDGQTGLHVVKPVNGDSFKR